MEEKREKEGEMGRKFVGSCQPAKSRRMLQHESAFLASLHWDLFQRFGYKNTKNIQPVQKNETGKFASTYIYEISIGVIIPVTYYFRKLIFTKNHVNISSITLYKEIRCICTLLL